MPFVSLSRIAAFIVALSRQRCFSPRRSSPNRRARSIVATASIVRRTTHAWWVDCAGDLSTRCPAPCSTSTGTWCDPGFRESKFKPGGCVPGSYTECSATVMCAPGDTCGTDGDCHAGDHAQRSDLRQAPVPRRSHLRQHREVHEHARTSRTAAMARSAPNMPAASIRAAASWSARRGRSRSSAPARRPCCASVFQADYYIPIDATWQSRRVPVLPELRYKAICNV